MPPGWNPGVSPGVQTPRELRPKVRAMSSAALADDADRCWTLPLAGGLVARATTRPESPLLERFYDGYDRVFVLPDEKEDLAGFRACLALNPASRHRFGRTHGELVAILLDDAGVLLGGANFLATAIPRTPGHPEVAVALNYLYVEPAVRGRGLSHMLLDAVAALARRAVGLADKGPSPAIFIEQNDPLRMTPADYAADTARSGIDQVARLRVWHRLGARVIDFPYVQPALSAGQEADLGLVYSVLRFEGKTLAARYLHDHLESFFGISVLKGGDPAADPVAGPQLARLAGLDRADAGVPVLDIGAALAKLAAPRGDWPQADSLRALARGQGV